MIKDVIHFYRVESLEKTKVFYQDILGFSVFKDQGKCLIFDTNGHGKLGFCTHFPKNYNEHTCITLVVESIQKVDEFYNELKHKVEILDTPTHNEAFKIYHFFIKDTQNITLEIQTFAIDT